MNEMGSLDVEEDRARRGKVNWELRLLRSLAIPHRLREIVDALATQIRDSNVQVVAAFEALGLPLGAAMACRLGSGLVCVRKLNCSSAKPGFTVEAFRDYEGEEKMFGIVTSSLTPGMHVLIADDYLETGAQLRAAIRLIERLQATVVGVVVIGRAQRSDVDLSDLARYPIYDLGAKLDSYIVHAESS
jgi:adenine phosphoribosyltransferase